MVLSFSMWFLPLSLDKDNEKLFYPFCINTSRVKEYSNVFTQEIFSSFSLVKL